MLLACSGRPGQLPPVNESDHAATPDIDRDEKLGGLGPFLAMGVSPRPASPAAETPSAYPSKPPVKQPGRSLLAAARLTAVNVLGRGRGRAAR